MRARNFYILRDRAKRSSPGRFQGDPAGARKLKRAARIFSTVSLPLFMRKGTNWLPLAKTPSHPEYPAAHGCVTGTVSTILAGSFGTPNLAFSVDSLVTNTTHNFTSTRALMHEVEDARIYAGFHCHHPVIQGRILGLKVGNQLMQRYFGQAR